MAASRRTGSSLYARSHGFGSGKKQWNVSYVCRSFQEPHQTLEAGDKIILPEAAFREVSRMKLPFPLLLRVVNSRLKNRRTDSGRAAKPGRPGGKPAGRPGAKAAGKPAQADGGKPAAKAPPVTEMYCGVIEFSAPAGEVMMPKWMMRSLHIREGGKADFTSIVKLPRGEWCVFRPHQEAFVQVIHDLGPRIFMETAMRNYSALSKGGTIVIDHFGETFKLDVVDTKPADSISLYGDCDLEVDFLPAKDSAAAAAGPSGAGQVVSGAPVPEAIDNTPIAQNVLEAVKKAAAAAAAGSDIVVSGDGAVTIAAPPQAGAATRNQPPKAATQQPLRPVGNAQPRRASASKAAPAQGHGGSGGGARHQSRADRLHAAAASGARPSGGGNKDAPPPPRVTATESRARKHRVSPREEPKPVQRSTCRHDDCACFVFYCLLASSNDW